MSPPRRAPKSSPELRPKPGPSPPRQTAPLEVVDPVWLIKAIAMCLLAALFCIWLTECLLVYQGAWQLVLHPTRTIDRTPASAGLLYEPVRFDAAETGQPRLTAWWIPAGSQPTSQPASQPTYAAFTILYLHAGSGSLSDTIPSLARLHRAGLNVFAIDYRGFGASDASVHPDEARMTQDAAAALEYLTSTRHIPTRTIIPYGAGLGASFAANLARQHSGLPAIILEDPTPDPAATAAAAHPSRIIPVRLLFGKRFDIATPLATLATPKLLIAGGSASTHSAGETRVIQTLYHRAASPSFDVTLPPVNDEDDYQAALQRFLDQYLPHPTIQPAP